MKMIAESYICHYFVDEAGDSTLFNKKGEVLLGTQGCSRYFMLGLLQVGNPETLAEEMNSLRNRLLSDPYFSGEPSMQLHAHKTAVAFHAKDDLPEVRRELFALLTKRQDLKFFAIIRDKKALLSYVRQHNQRDPEYRYDTNELYDYLVRSLFRDRLHIKDAYQIYFAKRGSSDRTESLKKALQVAKEKFAAKYHKQPGNASITVIPMYARQNPALQAADYFLWSLQRLYERGEDRYLSLLWPSYRLVIDMDDTKKAKYGTYYNTKNPLKKNSIADRIGNTNDE